ncbi:MAG: YkgJ family cysteine cluster protein [Candidatus Sericytochromatia bacterium]
MESGAYYRLFHTLAQELLQRPNQGLIFWWEDFEQFECSQCGSCCSRPWKIHVSQAEVAQWGAAWENLMDQPIGELLQIEAPDIPSRYAALAKQSDGRRCVFLGPDLRCRIHAALGEQAKPHICRKYPATGARLDYGHFQSKGLAGSCVSVGKNLSLSKTLNYRWLQLAQRSPLPLLPIVGGKHLDWGTWLCLTGFQLDSLLATTEIKDWLWLQGQWLGNLLRGPEVLDQAAFHQTLQLFQPQTQLPPLALLELRPLLNWLIEQVLNRNPVLHPLIDWINTWKEGSDMPRLNPSEKQALNLYLQAWMQKELLLQSHLIQGHLGLLHQLLAWGLNLFLIQLWALYERSLHGGALMPNDLSRAQNQIYAYIIQDYSPAGIQRIQAARAESCLVQLGLLGRLQWPTA